MKKVLLSLVFSLIAGSVHAQLFNAFDLPFYSQAPISQLGPIVGNTLNITPTLTGFIVSGQIQIQMPAGPVSGTLLTYAVDRKLNAGYGTNGAMTSSTQLLGFSQPPAGTYGNTSGVVHSYFTNYYPAQSNSPIGVNLVAGVDLPAWNPTLTATSLPFSYTSGGTQYLRQRFDVDGIQIAHAGGGIWIVDVPVTSIAIPVPEPGTALLGVVGCAAVAMLRRRR